MRVLADGVLHVHGILAEGHELEPISVGGGGLFRAGEAGVEAILTPADRKVEFICYADKTLCFIKSAMGYPAIYPLEPASIESPIKAVLMDLDGTSVHSEPFWIRVIEATTARILSNSRFQLEELDLPHVSGHSVSEHLHFCSRKYCPGRTVEELRDAYFDITREQMALIAEGKGWKDAFIPVAGLKEFLLETKSKDIKIGLVTSGLYEKAWPEIHSAFQAMGMGDPSDFYDTIITAGVMPGGCSTGTLGELESKPHPWLYAESGRVGLGIDCSQRNHVLGIEDSSAGIISIRLAGYPAIGVSGGNIQQSGVVSLCDGYYDNLMEISAFISRH